MLPRGTHAVSIGNSQAAPPELFQWTRAGSNWTHKLYRNYASGQTKARCLMQRATNVKGPSFSIVCENQLWMLQQVFKVSWPPLAEAKSVVMWDEFAAFHHGHLLPPVDASFFI